jgi:nucleoside-diphosphate-sugar epimerase
MWMTSRQARPPRATGPAGLGRLDVPHSLNYLPDVARALAILGTRREALGEVWHLPTAEPVTGRGFVELIAAALGRPVKVTATSRLAPRIAGLFDPRARELEAPVRRARVAVVGEEQQGRVRRRDLLGGLLHEYQ